MLKSSFLKAKVYESFSKFSFVKIFSNEDTDEARKDKEDFIRVLNELNSTKTSKYKIIEFEKVTKV